MTQVATVDCTALHQSHEVVLRVELLEERIVALGCRHMDAVAEVGLGSGDTTKMLVEQFYDVTCVDIEQARLDEVAEFIAPSEPRFVCADAASVIFLNSLNHIFLIGLLEHCQDGEAVLLNLKKYLKPRGRIHILVNNAQSIHRYLGVAIGNIENVHELSPSDHRFGHHRIYTPNSLYAEISRAGLLVDYVDQHYMKPLPSKMMDKLPLELSRSLVEAGRRFPQFAAYTYCEAVLP